MGFTMHDLSDYLAQHVRTWSEVARVWALQPSHSNEPFRFWVAVKGGLTGEGYDNREAVHARIAAFFEERHADADLVIQYHVIPFGEFISPPNIPKGALPIEASEALPA